MVQLSGSGPRATPPPRNSATGNHYDDDQGYVSLSHDGAEYRLDEEESPSDQWVDEEPDNLPPLGAPRASATQPQHGSPLRKRRKGSRTPTAGSRTPRASSYPPPPQYAQGTGQSRLGKESGIKTESRQQTPTLRPASPAPAAPPPNLNTPLLELPKLRTALRHTIVSIGWLLDYTFSIVRPAVHYLRYPLIVILFLYLVASILSRVSSTFSAAFSPLCYTPGLSYLPMCKWVSRPPPEEGGAHRMWADLVDLQSRTFEQLIDNAVATTNGDLALDIKKAEMATADLIALVRLSDLHSKDSLAEALGEFVHDAKIAGRYLHRLDSKMNGALDSIMAMNDFALNAIDSARAKEPGIFGSLMIWKPSRKPVDEVVKETFGDAMHVMSTHLERLILELETNYANLDKLENKLSTLHNIVVRENSTVSDAKEELLENLWTMLGGNRKELRNFQRNLKLLHDLTVYRKHAAAHVVSALHSLQRVSQDLEDMRERSAAPNLAGDRIVPEVHMKSIKNGLENLREGRSKVRKIEAAALRRALGVDENGLELGS